MLSNLLQLISGRSSPGYEQGFIRETPVRPRRVSNPQINRIFLLGWVLIALKTAFVLWAVPRFHIPWSPYWIVVPTMIFGALCTFIYYRR